MGGFNLPMFVFFLLVTALVAVPLLIWSELPTWIVLLASPVASYVAINVFGFVIDSIEGRQEPYDGSYSDNLNYPKGDEEKSLVLPEKTEGLSCPSCSSEDIAMVLYGLTAMNEHLEKAIENGEVTLGGCVVHDEALLWVCNECNRKFGRLKTDGYSEMHLKGLLPKFLFAMKRQ